MSMLHDLSMIFLNRIGTKPVELLYDITSDLPVQLYGDSQRLRQVIINLVNNAIKFTERGYVRLKVEAETIGENELKLFFSVEDTGQGIREEDIGKLFASFQQVDAKKNYKKEGTGLGLAISKQLVELMQGEINVESTYGEGSVFSFYIIQKIVDVTPATSIKRTLEDTFRIENRITSPAAREQLMKLADEYGIECVDMDDSAERTVDYVITDNMDHITGTESAKVCVLQNPMLETISNMSVIVINKPLYSMNFCQLINGEEQVFVRTSTEEQKFTAPQAQILVVDDNEINLKVARGLLAPYQMHIDSAENGEKAVQMVKEKHYDLVFMDHMMPVMDGIEATIQIRKLEGDYYQKLPIIALSANATSDAKDMFLKAGMNDFIAKPIREKELEACVREWLPKELQIVSDKAVDKKTETEGHETEGLEIEGLDMEEGIKNCGSTELLMELIGDFYTMIDSKSARLEQYFEEGKIRDYTIEVHALKNNARMIGAIELSQQFYRMEQFGNEGKQQEIGQELPQLLKFYRSYKDKLSEFAKPAQENKVHVSGEKIKQTLVRLHDAVDSFDLDAADDAMNELDSYELPEELKPMAEQLRIYVTDVEMENIMELTQKMCQLC